MWVGQRVADGSGNVLDRDLGAEVRKKIIRAPFHSLTFVFDAFTKSRWKDSVKRFSRTEATS